MYVYAEMDMDICIVLIMQSDMKPLIHSALPGLVRIEQMM